MEFLILGALEVRDGGRQLALGAPKQRALLAILLIHANEPVPRDRLIDELWGESPPARAAHSVQVYVSQLRKLLEVEDAGESAGVLRTAGLGYELRIGSDQLDLWRFERLCTEGRKALVGGEPGRAAAVLREALQLWRGPPLADFSYEGFAQTEIVRLDGLRLQALEDRVDADLALARHADLIPELEALASAHPRRERLRGQLMLSLYQSGRQTDALETFRQYRQTLDEQLGLEPGRTLQKLEAGILNHEPRLDPPQTPGLPAAPRPPTRGVGALETRYAKSGDVSIAYQVVGDGPFDLIHVPGFVSHVQLRWGVPGWGPILDGLASFSRLILFDKRGTGMSDRVSGAPTLETRMDDLRAVMDAAGSTRAALFGVSEGAPMSLLFAATYPERTAALVLRSGYPRTMWAPDYPWGRTEDEYRRDLDHERALFGPREQAEETVRSLGWRFENDDVPAIVDYLRLAASPGAVEALARMNRDIDVRHVLPAIRVPTLILHGSEDTVIPLAVASYMAKRIPGARLVELKGGGHLHFGQDSASTQAEAARFLNEVWQSNGWGDSEPDRVLATVLVVDIVGSNARAASLGNRAWNDLLERHHGLTRRQVVRFRGREVETAGDGFFASFDGPARAIRCARAILDSTSELGLETRTGLHTGECELVDHKMAGIAVQTGARVAAHAQPGEVLVSRTVKDLVAGSNLTFEDRGTHELQDIPGEWHLYSVA